VARRGAGLEAGVHLPRRAARRDPRVVRTLRGGAPGRVGRRRGRQSAAPPRALAAGRGRDRGLTPPACAA
jgi:hypothetical protein